MYIIYNRFKIFLKNIRILLIFSNFNKNLSYIIINNFYKRLKLLGFLFKNLLIIIINGSLDIIFFIRILFDLDIFDIYIILGVILKNKTFHFEVVSYNTTFFISKLSYTYYKPVINCLTISNNKFFFLNKLIKINNDNLKIFLKFLNFLYFLKLY
ncbi:6,7-dimethyl-8-ribityllumazine synthase [Candidatus Nasuia deltocephalinicola]|nr:6,7-dimethyl-8-ribityllumazine synthase [Candidatus Nasuia deltocephalinicola]